MYMSSQFVVGCRRTLSAVVILNVLLTATLAPELRAQQPAVAPAPLPTVTLPAELARVLRDYERAWRANDVDELIALFTSDGMVMQPGRPAARGPAGLASVYKGQGGGALRLRPFAFGAADTVAYILGAYGYGEGTNEDGKFTLTLRRERGGKWLIASDMDNGNRPARPPQ
jgi:ketosteroid isomerase-like protein